MASKWLVGGVLLALAALILGWIFGMPKVGSMENDIRKALDSKGYQNIQVDMRGNVATLTGDAASEAAKADAVSVAKNTECSACKNKRRWHAVKDKMALKSLPVQNPFTFNGEKRSNGRVILSGYVPSEKAKSEILDEGNRIFGTKVIDRTISVAAGAPDARFVDVTKSYMKKLAQLEKGSFSQENFNGLLKGTASTAAVRDAINSAGQKLPGKYASGFGADISVPKPPAAPAINTASECQTLFEEIKGDKRILFETNAANIKGAASFDLLNEIAAAANRCSSFNITIGGHTDSIGNEAYNQRLSEARAATVRNYLTEQQVEGDRLIAKGFGETQPQATNETPEGRAENRRITFTVTQAQ